MEILHIERKSEDNKYLHRDFFVSGDIGISYVGNKYGDDAVKEYLTKYALSFYKPLAEKVLKNGLCALEEYFFKVYEKEEWQENLKTTLSEKSLEICVKKCPAVTFMKSSGHTPSKWYKQTTCTVYGTLAKMCNLNFNLYYYNEIDGSTKFCFVEE